MCLVSVLYQRTSLRLTVLMKCNETHSYTTHLYLDRYGDAIRMLPERTIQVIVSVPADDKQQESIGVSWIPI